MDTDALIEDLEDMLDEGAITREEYDTEMARIVAGGQAAEPDTPLAVGDLVVLSRHRTVEVVKIESCGEVWFSWADVICHVSPFSLRGKAVIKASAEQN